MANEKGADAGALGGLHELVTRAFIKKVQEREVTRVSKDGEEVTEIVEPSAAELAAAVTFLKNNNITCAPSEDNAVGELKKLMDARRARSRPVLPDTMAELPSGDFH